MIRLYNFMRRMGTNRNLNIIDMKIGELYFDLILYCVNTGRFFYYGTHRTFRYKYVTVGRLQFRWVWGQVR